MYIWEAPDWPHWQYDLNQLSQLLAKVRYQQGRFTGAMESFGFKLREEAVLTTLTQDILKSCEIEGEFLNADQVRSSIARRLGLDIGALASVDRYVEGVVEMMLDATRNYDQSLTVERLFAWHGALFPTGRSGLVPIRTAIWRDDINGSMQVISGPFGHEKVHYIAPPADRLRKEADIFLEWFNACESGIDPVLKAGLAHLWFITLHPFEDGNGRIARALGDMALARSENSCQRFYSLSAQIQQDRSAYYDVLENTQRGGMDVTDWLLWFLSSMSTAMDKAEGTLSSVIRKARFWEQYGNIALNDRQIKVINLMFDGFEGKLTTSKWAKLTKCSQDSAYRDIVSLMQHGVLSKNEAGGRGTSYDLKWVSTQGRI